MILISCIDDRGGLLFHGRRLSRDRVLCQDVLRTCAGSPLWMAPGSRSLFSSLRDGLSSSILITGAAKAINASDALSPVLDDLDHSLNQAMTSISTSVHDLHDE